MEATSKIYIKKIHIENFKCFKGVFNLELKREFNILVGDNEAGKSTLIEAIHLALTGFMGGKYITNELTQYLFNKDAVDDYVKKIAVSKNIELPYILIELFLEGDGLHEFDGDENSEGIPNRGLSLRIGFDDIFKEEYDNFLEKGNIKTIPIEFYKVNWRSFSRKNIVTKSIPMKSVFIDSSSNHYQNGSDIYISRIIKDALDAEDIMEISRAHREMKDSFIGNSAIETINEKIKSVINISDKDVKLSIDLSSKNSWETNLMTYLDNIPFHNVGKGEQCTIKTKLALGHKKSVEANVILFEEPENHLSHTRLNQLIYDIENSNNDKQVIISTHNSFIANKLGLENLILLNENKEFNTREKCILEDLNIETKSFFQKLSGYETLRLLLCKKVILVEGDSDELIVQKAYRVNNKDKLPIQDGIDVVSVGTSFLRFLEIAEHLKKPVSVVTDNDGNVEALRKKYKDYLDKEFINICFDETMDEGEEVGFNYNTLEPKMLKENGLEKFNIIFDTNFKDINEMHKYMKGHKTECALRIFSTDENVSFPEYILKAIKDEKK